MRVPSTDDVSIELHDLGGDGPTLLVAHATGFCAGAYRPMAAALAARFHVWALDFRGHGDSSLPTDGDLTWRGMADDVLAVTDALTAAGDPIADRTGATEDTSARAETGAGDQGGGVFAIGHSMGGACLMAAELRQPGTLRAAYLFEPIIVPPGFDSMSVVTPLAASARRRRPTFASRPEALARYAGRPPLGTFRADALAAYVEHGFADAADATIILKCDPETEAATFEATGEPLSSEMGPIATPTVVACGARYPSPGPADFAPYIAEAIPGATLTRFGHVGHFGPFQDPDSLAEDIIEAFLGR